MSFSKAKIQRFNELGSEVPPPGAYDPKFDNKVKGLVIEKCDRFLDTKSTYNTECSVSTSGKNSTSISFPAFRTPQMPRKRLTIKAGQSSIESRSKLSFLTKSQDIKYEYTQQLADLEVECLNKNKTIQEHEKHLEEMKGNMRKLENVLEELHNKQAEIEEQHTKDIETMAKLQQEVLDNHDKKHQAEVQMLCSQLSEMSEEKEQEFSTRRTIEIELRNRATELSKRITMLEELCTKKEEDKKKIEILEMNIEEYLSSIMKIQCDRDDEIQLLQEKLLYEKCKLNLSVTDLMQARSDEVKLEEQHERMLQLYILLCAFQCELEYFKLGHFKFLSYTEKTDYIRLEQHLTCIRCMINDFLREEKIFVLRDQLLEKDVIEASTIIKKIEETDSDIKEELQGAVVERLYEKVKRLHGIQAHSDAKSEQQLIIYLKQQQWESATNHYEQKYLEQLNEMVAKDEELNKLKQTFAEKVEEKTKQVTERAEKMMEDAKAVASERLTACRIESEERVKRTIIECDAKVNVMIKDTQNTVEEEMQLAAERYKMYLARMEVERIALDEKLSQRDAEITKLSATLEELRSSVETQESFSQSLQIELDRAEAELAEKKEELRSLKDHIRAEAAEMVARRKRFEIIMAENQASVAALTNRLAQSNAEVERLQHELKRGEDCIDEHRDLLSVMRNNSQLVHEQVHTLMKELDTQRELVSQLEAGSLSEFESIKPVFEAKIENLKQMAAKEITKLQNDCEMKSLENEEMKKQLDEMAINLNEAQNLLLRLEERADSQTIDISRIELAKNKLVERLKYQEKTLEENNQLIQAQATQHKEDMNKANSRIEELTNEVKEFEDKEKYSEETASLLEQERVKWKTLENALMRQLQEEKELRKETEKEVRKVTESHRNLRMDYDEINKKYTEVIGHQNPKQRIKHVTQLKDKIYQLEQELCDKTKLVEQQQKTIKSLKTEEKRSQWKGKENQGMVHSTPICSPHKLQTTPLRNRND